MDRNVGALLLELQPDVDQSFLDENRDLLLAALVERPGVDSVRAAVLREVDRFEMDEEERQKLLAKVAESLRDYPDAVASGDPLQLMARHPAWVGLCHLELVDRLDGDREAAFDVALQHARLGFSSAAGGPVQDGETLWALAETAEEVGWTERAVELLERSLRSSFADEEAHDQVALLLAMSLAGNQPGEVQRLLEPIVEGHAPFPLRIQAAFVLARVAEGEALLGDAIDWLQRAVALAEEAGDEDVLNTLKAELTRLAVA